MHPLSLSDALAPDPPQASALLADAATPVEALEGQLDLITGTPVKREATAPVRAWEAFRSNTHRLKAPESHVAGCVLDADGRCACIDLDWSKPSVFISYEMIKAENCEPRLFAYNDSVEKQAPARRALKRFVMPAPRGYMLHADGQGYLGLTKATETRRLACTPVNHFTFGPSELSESSAVRFALANGVHHDFLGLAPETPLVDTWSGRRRMPESHYHANGTAFPLKGTQLELNQGLCTPEEVKLLLEAKMASGQLAFNVRQLLMPLVELGAYYPEQAKSVALCFVLVHGPCDYTFYEVAFDGVELTSARVTRAVRYVLEEPSTAAQLELDT